MRMSTKTAPKQWLGLGKFGWGVAGIIALVNLYTVLLAFSAPGTLALWTVITVAFSYVFVRILSLLYRFVKNVFA